MSTTPDTPAPIAEPERVTRLLRDQIVDGDRPPGSRLVERELAAALGVSRVPVREALQTLAAEGLVTQRPRSWAVVRTFTDDDLLDLVEVRSAIEVLTVRLAAERRTPEQLRDLSAALARETSAASSGDATEARRAAADFHEVVSTMAGNTVLDEISALTASRMRWMLGQHDDLGAMAAEHAALLDAVRDGDVERADCLAQEHLRTSLASARARRAQAAG
ncbi:transcriptional regulator, GntR family [Sanguibacter keddieii DSM 10542]|uniref:Transcriptional regulator, GntR family n=1 Tax=Sanguibacter keddieii (strain ATCC 51767 / DSM 10542 / NCFB 3025 / ST-74) TaxID=446469 RepID=D1BB02_SANKS|nr:GntR family transcriptional regulator [Sanguibacter keddieii]ACZ22703.1 transcriptional regulator, GntR family [Sanguibacter keddieii DSM 10542]